MVKIEKEKIKNNKSIFILNDEYQEIESIIYKERLLTIKTINNCILNIDLNIDITKLKTNKKENISKKIYKDQNFITNKYSYVIYIGKNVYLTKNNDDYLLEIKIPKVDILIPPYENINNKRLEKNYNYNNLEIKKLEVKVYFK